MKESNYNNSLHVSAANSSDFSCVSRTKQQKELESIIYISSKQKWNLKYNPECEDVNVFILLYDWSNHD